MSKLFIDNRTYDCPDTAEELDWEQFMSLLRFGHSTKHTRARLARRILEKIGGVEPTVAAGTEPEEYILFAECYAARIFGGMEKTTEEEAGKGPDPTEWEETEKRSETTKRRNGREEPAERRNQRNDREGEWEESASGGRPGESVRTEEAQETCGATRRNEKEKGRGRETAPAERTLRKKEQTSGSERENGSGKERFELVGTGKNVGTGVPCGRERRSEEANRSPTETGDGKSGEKTGKRIGRKANSRLGEATETERRHGGPGRRRSEKERNDRKTGRGKHPGRDTKKTASLGKAGNGKGRQDSDGFAGVEERLSFPEEIRGFEGETIPMANLSAEEFCEATDLYLEDKWSYAPLIAAVLCRPEEERYDERKTLERAERLRRMPMGIVLRLYATLEKTHRRMKEKYPLCYASPLSDGRNGNGGREATRWNDLMMWAGHHLPGETQRVKRMNAYDFMALVHSRIKMQAHR